MSIQAFDAAAAYGQTLKRPATGGLEEAAQGATAGISGSPFGAMVEKLVGDVVQTSRASEALSAQAVAGKADLVDVVTAVNNAEAALETMVAVRDRVISAYQDIMRMPI